MASPSDYYPIVGIQDGLNPEKHEPLREVHLRMEVDDWFTSDKSIHANQRALFFPALWKFSQMSPQEKLSWFQIAVVFEFMKEKISRYPGKDRPDLEEAARTWRLPYWDWALKKPVNGEQNRWDYSVPLAILNKTVEIRQPGSEGLVPFKNALYQFTMPGNIAMGDWSLRNGEQDLRVSAVTTPDKNIFPFEDFATERALDYGPKGKKEKKYVFGSGENIHDLMHINCGGNAQPDSQNICLGGHMAHVPVAAFDPIFWIHHCNVDRMTAIWQILHDDTWFDGEDPRDKDNGTYSIKEGHPDKPDDPLRPFHKEGGGYWTSSDVREVTALGYTYPGLEKWHYTTEGKYDKQKHLDALWKKLNWAYNSDWSAAQKSRLTANPGEPDGLKLARLSSLRGAPTDMFVDDYVVNVIYEKFELDGYPFEIHIFVGKVPDETPYKTGHAQVGQVVNFSVQPASLGDSGVGCGNCRRQQANHIKSTGCVALTNALITRYKNQIQHENSDGGPSVLKSMGRADVVPFLKSNLHWRVTSRGVLVDLPSLKVSLAVGKAEHYADRTKMSVYHAYKPAYEVTRGRPGGAEPGDYLYPPHR
ncbi:common central domain of tyrosinase-domain-containing protein [Daldinia caldariorum]|uniref:common central domain of tyrosinase-domain-containing protein n=1 Tax=Daldinia caldariorum TaxID=326644 RepID=UPI002007E35F|nr:common central domain of tyrosinase-domain-containing protein [Daldinia caldariorum]KAI1470529.1 common central domain of tyrosinase-domain-containing protein [Daldinia caldariorum]